MLEPRRLRADLSLAVAIELVQKLSGFVVLAIVTRRFAPAAVGEFLLAFTLGTIAAVITEAGTGRHLIREVAQRPAEGRTRLGEVLALRLRLALLSLSGLIAAGVVVRPSLLPVLIPAAIALVVSELYFAFGGFLLGHRRVGLRFVTGLVGPLLGIGLALAAAESGARLHVVLSGWAAGAMIGVVAAAAVVRSSFGPIPLRHSGAALRQATRASLPFFAMGVLALVHLKADTLLLFGLAGPVAVASYEAGYKLLEASRMALRPALLVLYPVSAALAATDPPALRQLVQRLLLTAVALGIMSSIALVGLAPALLSLAWGPEYVRATDVARILFLAVPAMYVELAGIVLAGAVHREGAAARLLGAALVTSVLLNLLAIPRWGLAGAAWTAVFTQTAAAVALVLLLRQGVRALDRSVH
jgi:O-antigen/teichoic acid export membrane protein